MPCRFELMTQPWEGSAAPRKTSAGSCQTCGAAPAMTPQQAISAIKERYPYARAPNKKIDVVVAKDWDELAKQAAECDLAPLDAASDAMVKDETAKQTALVKRGVITQAQADDHLAMVRRNVKEMRDREFEKIRKDAATHTRAFYCIRDQKVHVVKGAAPNVLKHELLHASADPKYRETIRGFPEFDEAMTERLQWGMKGGAPASATPEYLHGPYKLAEDREMLGGADAMERAYFLGDFGPMRAALQKANPPRTLEAYMYDFRDAMYPPPPKPAAPGR